MGNNWKKGQGPGDWTFKAVSPDGTHIVDVQVDDMMQHEMMQHEMMHQVQRQLFRAQHEAEHPLQAGETIADVTIDNMMLERSLFDDEVSGR